MSDFERKMGKASLGAIAGIGAAGVGSGIVDNQKKYNEDKKEADKKRLEEKFKEDREPAGSGSESKAKPLNYKKGGCAGYKAGGKVRGCGIAQKGLTKGRMV